MHEPGSLSLWDKGHCQCAHKLILAMFGVEEQKVLGSAREVAVAEQCFRRETL